MALRLLACLYVLACTTSAIVITDASQIPLQHSSSSQRLAGVVDGNAPTPASRRKKVHGRFLHITDMHPDPFYKVHSDTDQDSACHRGHGPAGYYGAETSDCDSPLSLVNETFKWVEKHLKDKIDFIIWTGDSARHDNDEHIPRTEAAVVKSNQWLADKFKEVFWDKETMSLSVPVVPTFGNNDILPHNLFNPGPNKWTRRYLDIWKHMIPEAQRHQFVRGGWFWVEVIPNQLAVFSLNTMYFFTSNAAVDGCADKSEPGYEHFEWLRIQLQMFRSRGMKVILSGHVPPARNDGKVSWDETCWQKYALWMQQYRDIIIGSMYGHMNVEHFILQDFEDIDKNVRKGIRVTGKKPEHMQGDDDDDEDDNDDLSIASHKEYLMALREQWANLPTPPHHLDPIPARRRKSKEDKFYDEIGGEWGERYAVSLVSASVVPNYFPTLRVIEYNVTGIDAMDTSASSTPYGENEAAETFVDDDDDDEFMDAEDEAEALLDVLRKKKKKKKRFHVPKPPSKSAPPGPAYSPQPFSWISYTQYFANITYYNNDFINSSSSSIDFEAEKWNDGKHSGKKPKKDKPQPLDFDYAVEYDTAEKKDIYSFKDSITVRQFINLATRIGNYDPKKDNRIQSQNTDDAFSDLAKDETNQHELSTDIEDKVDIDKKKKKKKHKKHKKHKRRKIINKTWYSFVERAFASSVDPDELDDSFGEPIKD